MVPELTQQAARDAKLKNIIELSFDFSTMTRVFEKKSTAKILNRLTKVFEALSWLSDQTEYDRLHSEFCDWFIDNICTAERKFGGSTKAGCPSSYGQAAKVLDVAVKVYVYYCGQPSAEIANGLLPMLHAALDNDMMKHLGHRNSLQKVDQDEYLALQNLVKNKIVKSGIYAVQYDDIMWRSIQRNHPAGIHSSF